MELNDDSDVVVYIGWRKRIMMWMGCRCLPAIEEKRKQQCSGNEQEGKEGRNDLRFRKRRRCWKQDDHDMAMKLNLLVAEQQWEIASRPVQTPNGEQGGGNNEELECGACAYCDRGVVARWSRNGALMSQDDDGTGNGMAVGEAPMDGEMARALGHSRGGTLNKVAGENDDRPVPSQAATAVLAQSPLSRVAPRALQAMMSSGSNDMGDGVIVEQKGDEGGV
uniref:DUF834 domain-containing protein n=2 Tax=Oryza TaxID=4527 RepID=A0A0D3GY61_9ORYZ